MHNIQHPWVNLEVEGKSPAVAFPKHSQKEAKSICNICPVKYGNAPTPNQSGNRAERGCFCRNNILDLGGWINHTWKALTFSIIVTRANQYPLLKLVLRLFDYVQIAPKTRRFNVSYETRTNSSWQDSHRSTELMPAIHSTVYRRGNLCRYARAGQPNIGSVYGDVPVYRSGLQFFLRWHRMWTMTRWHY